MLRKMWNESLVCLAIGALVLAARAEPGQVAEGAEAGQEPAKKREASPEQLERLRLDLVTGSRPAPQLLSDVETLQQICESEQQEYKPEHSRARELARLGSSIRLLRAEILLQLGRLDEAKAVLDAVAAAGQARVVDSQEFTRLMEFLQRAVAPDEMSADVRAEVENALLDGNLALLKELGTIAIPSLEAWIVAHPDDFPTLLEEDALWLLRALDLRRGGAFALEHYDLGGYLWKRRIARVLRRSDALDHGEHWSEGNEVPKACLQPEWLEILERLVEDPEFGADVMIKVQVVADYRGTSSRLQAALQTVLAVGDARRDALVDQVLRQRSRFGEDMRSVLEAAVAHPDATIRQLAAVRLHSYERSDALLARWSDPDPQVRAAVVSSFRPHANYSGANVVAPLTPEARGMLATLVNDSDARVRREVLGVLLDRASDGLDFALYERLTRDSEPDIRRWLALGIRGKLPLARCAELWLILANDVDREVVVNIDNNFNPQGWGDEVDRMLPVLEARMMSTNHPWRRLAAPNTGTSLGRLNTSNEGLDWLVRKGLEWNDEEMLRMPAYESSTPFRLAPELLPAYVERLFELQPNLAIEQNEDIWDSNPEDQPQRESVIRTLVEVSGNSALDPRLRFLLASLDGRIAGTRVADAAIATMTDARWKPGGPWTDAQWLWKTLNERLRLVVNEEHNRILLAVLAHPDAAPDMRAMAARLLRPYARNGVEAVQAVLARWLDDVSTEHPAVSVAIRSIGTLPIEGKSDILRRLVRERRYVKEAASAMASSRDESFVPDLAAILQDPATRDWDEALTALGSFLTDEAAEALLEVSAQVTVAARRQVALAAVEEIRTYQEARERWTSRRLGRQTREQATEELLGMLADPDARVRGEAALGLATLGAIESIPRLIRLLQDPAEEVRGAASQALDSLHRMAQQELEAGAATEKQDG